MNDAQPNADGLFTGEAETVEPVTQPDDAEPIIDAEDVEEVDDGRVLAKLSPIEQELAVLKEQSALSLQRSQVLIEYNTSMRTLIAGTVRENHWVRFGDKVRPDGSECKRLRARLGVRMELTPPERFDYTDEAGTYYVYVCSGQASHGPVSVPCYGAASSRTKFFSRAHGKARPIDQIDPAFIATMAWGEAFKNGVRTLFGLDLDPDEIKGISGRVIEDKAGDMNKDKTGGDSADDTTKRREIGEMILMLAGNDKALASAYLESLTTFKPKGEARLVPGKKSVAHLTQRQVQNLHKHRDKDLSQTKFDAWLAARQEQSNG